MHCAGGSCASAACWLRGQAVQPRPSFCKPLCPCMYMRATHLPQQLRYSMSAVHRKGTASRPKIRQAGIPEEAVVCAFGTATLCDAGWQASRQQHLGQRMRVCAEIMHSAEAAEGSGGQKSITKQIAIILLPPSHCDHQHIIIWGVFRRKRLLVKFLTNGCSNSIRDQWSSLMHSICSQNNAISYIEVLTGQARSTCPAGRSPGP